MARIVIEVIDGDKELIAATTALAEAISQVVDRGVNDAVLRARLASRGIAIPATTLFVGALHNTTTDEVTLFDGDTGAPDHQTDLAAARTTLACAGVATRRARAPRLGLAHATQQHGDARGHFKC